MKLKIFIERPVLSIVISVAIVLLGCIALVTLPVEQFPNIAPPTVEVTTSYPGANAETVQKSVIVPLEEAINGVENMTYISSTASNAGDVYITIYFKQGTDPDMAAQNIESATGSFGENYDGVFQYTMKYRGRFVTQEEFGDIVIKSLPTGEVLRLEDVARIELGDEAYTYKSTTNGHPGSTFLIYQTAGSNASEVIENIDAKLEEMKKDLPEGMRFDDVYSTKAFLDASMHQVIKTLFEAFLLVVIITFIFLQDVRSMVIPTISILVSLIGTFAFMSLAGFSINLLTMFATGAGANGNSSLGSGVIGGMIFGTLGILFFVPVFFCLFQYIQERVKPVDYVSRPEWIIQSEIDELKEKKKQSLK